MDKWTENEWHDEDNPEEPALEVSMKDEFYGGRNYDLFAMLADVRNGYGTAGIDTGDGFKPISEPKGLPPDVSKLVKTASDNYGADGHSHSYLTLRELEHYDWYGQTTAKRGWVTPKQYKKWKITGGVPDDYIWGAMGLNIKHITNEEMDEYIRLDGNLDKKGLYTTVEWKERYVDCAKEFRDETMPKLHKLLYDREDSSNVRIVFWFDN